MTFRSWWQLEVRCNSEHQAAQVLNHVAQSINLTLSATHHPFSSAQQLVGNGPGFNVRFELEHDVDQLDLALAQLLGLSRKLAGHWELVFLKDGRAKARASHVKNAGRSAVIKWGLGTAAFPFEWDVWL